MKVASSISLASVTVAAAALLLTPAAGAAVADANIAAPSLLRGRGAEAGAAASSSGAGRALDLDQRACWNTPPSAQNATQVLCTTLFLTLCAHGEAFSAGTEQDAIQAGINDCGGIMTTWYDSEQDDYSNGPWNVQCCYYHQ